MFLANENFPKPSITLLRNAAIKVGSIQEDFPGISDEEVLQIAITNNQIILTFDKDYGEIIFRNKLSNPPAVIFFREKGANPFFAGQTLLSLLQTNEIKFENTFTVIERENIRQRSYSK
jgi:predicted nuclease of predicted toxin-antitoxin system